MNKKEAEEIISSTFSNNFDEQRYKKFVSNLFKTYKPEDKIVEGQYIKLAYKDFLIKYKIVGNFEDREGHEIDILEVNLNKASTLERARTAQRNFVAEYLKTRNKDAALVAFISPNNKEWRLSLVKIENSLEVVNEKLKTKEEITPAKRWSFLVGKNEGSHTARSRFINMLTSDEDPNLAELEAAFDIETVTKEFFNKYTELYFRLKEHLDSLIKKDETIKKDFEEKEISTVDFAKKTLGQIVFLYFLQKKGWFGVAPDKQWGEGPKKFLRELFERRERYGANFFNDILEPLFYEALAQDRGVESIYPRLNNCRMPFLNGGLFEPMNGYLWETTDIIIPDELFSNNHTTKEGDKGDGILDVFDRYNFTVNENEPLEKEVAVDPEMLGKVFENLLDIKDRKSKGAFYTPREIVHYMCQESLINYLQTETNCKIPRNDLEFFIQKGDRIIENDKIALARQENNIRKYGREYKDVTYRLLLPTSVRTNVKRLDELLQNIKVVDPAVGSGAFPLGMVNEIVRARKVLNVYLKNHTSDYELKKHTITHSIYGVDIDPGAVEIAKLRLWLALVVDEETPHPLPNLEYKIMQGNSLISEYEGIKLFDESIFDKEKKQKELALGFAKTSLDFKTEILQDKIESFINESQSSNKQNLKKEIDNLKWELIEETLKEQCKEDKLEDIKKLRRKNIRPFFIWKLEFSDVFKERGGFDVVIGNPPYITYKGKQKVNVSNEEIRYYIETYKNSAEYKINSYALFVERAFFLLKKEGVMSYIIPSTILQNEYLGKIRKHVLENYHIDLLVAFGNKVFQAVTDSIILQCSKRKTNDKTKALRKLDLNFIDNLKFVFWDQKEWFDSNTTFAINLKISEVEKKIISKIDKISVFLENFIEVYVGVVASGIKQFLSESKIDDNYKKYLQGKDLKRFSFSERDCFINFDIKKLHSNTDQSVYEQSEKVLVRKTGNILIASYDDSQFYTDQSIYNIYLKKDVKDFSLKYLCALLNAKILNWYFNKKMITNADVFPYIKGIHLKKLPIKKISPEAQQPFIDLVDQILEITSATDYNPKNPPVKQKELERQIDKLVYKLYGLTEEEIEIVENSLKKF